MDTRNWRSTESGDWRSQLQAASRRRMVNRIIATLKRHRRFSGDEGLREAEKVAVKFEEKIYTSATSPVDYLQTISLRMQTLEAKSYNPMPAEQAIGWRVQLRTDSRQRIVNKIMDTLKRHIPFSGPEGLQELERIAVRFEDYNYTAATSQTDYLRKISLKMLTMEIRSQNPSNPGFQVTEQVNIQGHPLVV